jgi:glutathione synthase/RimK-type ligase-like ATP-grasp enzyme
MQKRILILGRENSWSNQEIAKAIVNEGHLCEIYDPLDLFVYLGESKTGHDRTLGQDRIYFRSKDGTKSEKLIMKDFSGVITRLAGRSATYGKYVARAFEAKKLFVANIADCIAICGDKFRTSQILKRAFVPVPRQMLVYRSKDTKEALSIVDPTTPFDLQKNFRITGTRSFCNFGCFVRFNGFGIIFRFIPGFAAIFE